MNTYDDQGGSPPAWDSNDPNAPAQAPPPGYAAGPPALPTSGAAIASLVCGILSIPCCTAYGVPGILLGAAAIILWKRADSAVKQGTAGGSTKGLALGGLICGIVGAVLGLIYVGLLAIALLTGGFNQSGGSPFGP